MRAMAVAAPVAASSSPPSAAAATGGGGGEGALIALVLAGAAVVTGGIVYVVVSQGKAASASPTSPGTPSSPSSPSSPSKPAAPQGPLKKCWAYYTSDTQEMYVVDSKGTVHLVRDACAWYQAGYPWPLTAAARCTEAQIDAQATAYGLGSDVCNNSDSLCTSAPNMFGCGYKGRYGFVCSGSADLLSCPNPATLLDGTTVYSPCPEGDSMSPIVGTPCDCSMGWDSAMGAKQSAAAGDIAEGRLARGLMRSTAGVL
jgi:hypothetical protein